MVCFKAGVVLGRTLFSISISSPLLTGSFIWPPAMVIKFGQGRKQSHMRNNSSVILSANVFVQNAYPPCMPLWQQYITT